MIASFKKTSGFTLIEMLVSVAIIGVIASIVVYNHGKFDSDLEINNAAYRMALSARQAQVYGISAREVVGANSGAFSRYYGLHFNSPSESDNKNSFIFFQDTDGNGRYQTDLAGPGDDLLCASDTSNGGVNENECIEQTIIGRGIEITGFYGFRGGDWQDLSLPQNFSNLYAVDVLFKRPNPDADFMFYNNNYHNQSPAEDSCAGSSDCDGIAVCLASPQGREKRVIILSTGQISVENVEEDGICFEAGSGNGGGNGNGNGNGNNPNGGQGFGDDN